MDDAALAAAHGVEEERCVGALHLLGGGKGAHAQLFHAQKPVIIGVEGNQRMIFRRHMQGFHGYVLQGKQKLSTVFEQQLDIGA